MRVLVVDDDTAFVGMVTAALEEEGHTVTTASDGSGALASVHEQQPDAIILDLRMPDTDGRWFARAYTRRPGPHAPIVVISGHPDLYGLPIPSAVAYLSKPFDIDRLLTVLNALHH